MDNHQLKITIKNTQPIELCDFSFAFSSIAKEYYAFVKKSKVVKRSDVQVRLTEVRKGSIELFLDVTAPLLPLIAHAQTINDFAEHLKGLLSFFKGEQSDIKPDKSSCENIKLILEPIAKDHGSQIIFSPICNGNATYNITIPSFDANAIQNNCSREIEHLDEPSEKLYTHKLFYWYQVRNSLKSTGNLGIIESLSTKAVKTVYDSSDLRDRMVLEDKRNQFSLVYEVDVEVESIDEQPKLYKIIKIHEVTEK